MLDSSPDPDLISFSTSVYRALLSFYPARFKHKYGPHMAQVFRDCCLITYRQSGASGMLALWALTLFDWFKTVLEEQFNRGTEMTQSKFIRLSGWGMVLGAFSMTLAFFVTDAETMRLWMYRLLGAPRTPKVFETYRIVYENIGGWLGFAGVLLLGAGTSGLRLRYGKQAGQLGKSGLLLSMLGGGVTVAGMLSSTLIEWDGWWPIFMAAMAVQFGGLALFGAAALLKKPMPRWNGLPLVAGIGFPLLAVIYLLFRGADNVLEMPDWMINGMWLISLIGFTLLGYVLQADAPPEESVA